MEGLDFYITNRAKDATVIQEVMFGNYAMHPEVGFHYTWGRSCNLFKERNRKDTKESIKLPFRLEAGDTVFCSYDSVKANDDIKFFSRASLSANEQNSNLFSIDVEHSRSNKERTYLFELDPEYLVDSCIVWDNKVPLFQRWKYWPVQKYFS